MLINEHVIIKGDKTALIPYEEIHVLQYHSWMQSEELLKATASERLSIEEEYQMQKSWRTDEDKLTFIVVDKSKLKEGEVSAMIGDTNLFILSDNIAEVMIMIAEANYRRMGYGKEALSLILRYGIDALHVKRYEAKITSDNEPSIALFKKLGFEVVSSSSVFNEITLAKEVTKEWREKLNSISNYKLTDRSSQC